MSGEDSPEFILKKTEVLLSEPDLPEQECPGHGHRNCEPADDGKADERVDLGYARIHHVPKRSLSGVLIRDRQ